MRGPPAALTFPAVEFSRCKHIHPEAVPSRDGRTRTFDTQFWRLLFLPLNYVPMKLSKKKPPARDSLGAVSACGLAVGYMSGTVPLVASSIDWHGA